MCSFLRSMSFQKRRQRRCPGLSHILGVRASRMARAYPSPEEDVEPSNVKSKIESASKRHAEVEAKAIRVTVQNGNKVVLDGKVDNRDERRVVEDAAWSAAGVASVENRLTIA